MAMDAVMEKSLINLVNYHIPGDVYLEDYQRVELYIYDQNIIKSILDVCKFKDIGNVYDYPEFLPYQDTVVNGFDLTANYDMFQRIAISKKYNSIVMYTANAYSIYCVFLIDTDHLKKFSKKTKDLLRHDSTSNIFRDTDFKCTDREYIEVTDVTDDNTKPVEIVKKEVPNENLVFDEESTINEVMNDLISFFKDETKDLYKKLELPYKRGVILYGDPGNGKSAMIRQIIRTVPDITKVVINPNVNNVTKVLHSLTKALSGNHAIIVIEDIDSLIDDRNRSEFLNILDGIDIKSGIYFFGTTNYPDRIDPAFMNRSGRFDRTYKIDNPNESTRRLFYKSRKLGKLFSEYKVYNDDSIPDDKEGVIDIFVKYSEGLAMAGLKELITSASYLLASNTDMSVEDAVRTSSEVLNKSREEHKESHNAYMMGMQHFPRFNGPYIPPQM